MRFAITGCDRYLTIFQEFLRAGWTPVKLFSAPPINDFSTNRRMTQLAEQHGCPVQLTRMHDQDLRNLAELNCDALIVASYDWRIGDWRPYLRYAINFHPSPLPVGRGGYPLPRAILEKRKSWAMTCHKVEAEFDCGDILASEQFALHEFETHESLNLKLQIAGRSLARRLATRLEEYWDAAVPQNGGEYWPKVENDDRTLNFQASVDTILRTTRAFGNLGCYAKFDSGLLGVVNVQGWQQKHDVEPGEIVHVNDQHIVVAARDGYVALLGINRG